MNRRRPARPPAAASRTWAWASLGAEAHGAKVAPAKKGPVRRTAAEDVLGNPDASLLDVVDNVLNKGVVISGDVTIALAQVDLIYARLSLLLCAADRVLPSEERDVRPRHPRPA